jgi:hypothetical protein
MASGILTKHIEGHFECDFCNRQYKLKSRFEKHILMCSITSKTMDERKRENENLEKTPSVYELYEIIKQLVNKNEILERKVEKLSAWVNNNKKKINVLDWMNEHQNLNITFDDWLNSLQITKEDMELVFNYNFAEGIRFIIQRIIPDMTDDKEIPIKAFDQKDGIIYIFSGTESGWIIMSPEIFEKFFIRLTKGLLTQLKYWQDINRHRICDNGFTEVYIDNVKKITGGDLTKEQQYTKVKKMLYNHVKINLKNVIQYDFEF